MSLLKAHKQLAIGPEVEEQLGAASLATIERNLAQLRRGLVARRMSQTKPGTLLRKQIPVMVGKWKELDRPGYLEIDLVSHSGEYAVGGNDVATSTTAPIRCCGRKGINGGAWTGPVFVLTRRPPDLPSIRPSLSCPTAFIRRWTPL